MLVKLPPRQLRPEVVETVWPGDEAVDPGASDLQLWCRESGSAGLVIKHGCRPAIIRWRPLGEMALALVLEVMSVERHITFPYVAFRHGILSVEGEPLSWKSYGGVRGLDDQVTDALSLQVCDLPSWVLFDEFNRVRGLEVRERAGQESGATALPLALGYQILSATFRLRGERA